MKEIKAYIKPHKLYDTSLALQKVEGFCGMSVTDVKGYGRRDRGECHPPVVDELLDFAHYVKLEIICDDAVADELVGVIRTSAHTGLRGDGKIYLSAVDRVVKIGAGEVCEDR